MNKTDLNPTIEHGIPIPDAATRRQGLVIKALERMAPGDSVVITLPASASYRSAAKHKGIKIATSSQGCKPGMTRLWRTT